MTSIAIFLPIDAGFTSVRAMTDASSVCFQPNTQHKSLLYRAPSVSMFTSNLACCRAPESAVMSSTVKERRFRLCQFTCRVRELLSISLQNSGGKLKYRITRQSSLFLLSVLHVRKYGSPWVKQHIDYLHERLVFDLFLRAQGDESLLVVHCQCARGNKFKKQLRTQVVYS